MFYRVHYLNDVVDFTVLCLLTGAALAAGCRGPSPQPRLEALVRSMQI